MEEMHEHEVVDVGSDITPEEITPEPTDEVQVEVEVEPVETPEGEAKKAPKKDKGVHLKDAIRQVESFAQDLSDALQSRGNVVMVRVNDEALQHLDMLVDAEITKSRSESAAFLISEGIKANEMLFERIHAITSQIVELRQQLRQEVNLTPPEPEAEATESDVEL